MRTLVVCALSLAALLPGFSQTAVNAGAALQKDPRAVLAAATPLYDFSSPTLKPWHLKASYQLYDFEGKPTDQGTWEYWWVSPKVHRSSWTRAGSEHSEWSTAAGALYRKDSGSPLRYFERNIEETILSPLPAPADLDSGKLKLDLRLIPPKKPILSCVGTTFQTLKNGKLRAWGSDAPDYYCFDIGTLALLRIYSDPLTQEFSKVVKTQDRYLAEQVAVKDGKQTLFTASVDSIDFLNSADPELIPPADATLEPQIPAPPGNSQDDITTGTLMKKVIPIYPWQSKTAGVQGVVVLDAEIGTDGKVRDIEVLAAPSADLAQSAVDAVKLWEYKPYFLNGKAVEVETTIHVIFSLGG